MKQGLLLKGFDVVFMRLSPPLREKCPNMELFLVRFFPVFSPNTGK